MEAEDTRTLPTLRPGFAAETSFISVLCCGVGGGGKFFGLSTSSPVRDRGRWRDDFKLSQDEAPSSKPLENSVGDGDCAFASSVVVGLSSLFSREMN